MKQQKFYIIIKNQNDLIKINLNKKERFIRDYKYINIDETLIEIKEEEISKDYFLLKVVKDINKYRQLINDNNINIIQYPEGKNLNYSTGKIKSFNEYSNEFAHLASTERGSSGSPIFIVKNSNKNVVIGIHKQGKLDKSEYYGNFIYPIIKSLENNYIYDIKKYGKDEYEGEFKNNLKEGYGKYIYEDGNYYIGEWKNDLKHGKGIIYYKNNEIKYEGNFYEDKFEGYGKYIYEDGKYYIGEWKNNLRHGSGIMYYKNNNIEYEGSFYEDKMQGKGKYNYENGNYYKGEWKDNKKNGRGILFENNTQYEGEFINDEFKGYYEIIYEDDKLYYNLS